MNNIMFQIEEISDLKEMVLLSQNLNLKIEDKLQSIEVAEFQSDAIRMQREVKDLRLLYDICESKSKQLSNNQVQSNYNFRYLAKMVLDKNMYKELSKASNMYFKDGKQYILDNHVE